MLTKDIYGKTFSNYFNSSINSYAQRVKPKIVIDLLDSRHISLTANITNSDAYSNMSSGTRGYFFNEKQLINGFEREAFVWGVTDAKLKDGTVIKADGTVYALPSDLKNQYEFGFWSNTKSQANGVFASSPVVTIPFYQRKINKVRITTSETLGQVKSVRLRVVNANIGDIYDQVLTFGNDDYFKEVLINTPQAETANYNASQIILTVLSTKNGTDCARIHEVNAIYELDITDRVQTFSVNRSRDVHESNLPIGGSGSPVLNVTINNFDKAWNLLNTSSTYGPYMKKDLKVTVSAGWRILKTEDLLVNTTLRSNLSNSSNSISVIDASVFPNGGANNNFILTIDPDNQNQEIILCNSVQNSTTLLAQSRGYANTEAKTHSAGAVIQLDPYEYVPMGVYYVDEWGSSSSEMNVTISASDWTKFLGEKILEDGFLFENSTMGDAVKNLLLRTNFPNKEFVQLHSYTDDVLNKGAVARYSFKEEIIDRTGNLLNLSEGLRIRLYGMRPGREYYVKDIVSDALDRELTKEELASGVASYIAPDAVYVTSAISGNTFGANATLSLQDYTFVGANSITYTKYFNGTVDGYYIPLQNGLQNIELDITNGGARMYLDDTLIAQNFKNNKSLTTISASSYLGNMLNLQAGVPYKFRIDFYHADGDSNFRMHLYKNNSTNSSRSLIHKSETRTVVAKESLGALNPSFNTAVANFNHHYSDGIYYSNVELGKTSDINEYNQRSVLLVNNGYIRIPNNSTIQIEEKDFTFEFLAKFHNGQFSVNGEYISSWSNASPSNGFEFYYSDASTHGFKIKTTSGIESVQTANTALAVGDFYHIAATYDSSEKSLKYYINGEQKSNTVISGNVITQTSDITIGGRGSSHTTDVGPNAPSVTREFFIDEFAIYNKTLTAEDIKDRYISFKIKELTKFRYLYDQKNSIRQSIDSITLADIGRFFINEINQGRYEHYYRFYENIDQHANIQASLSDQSNIISADYQVQLQANKVVVKVSSVQKQSDIDQTLWLADDPSTLAVVSLIAQLNANDTEMIVSTTTDPVFFKSGYVVIDDEIIKYTGKTDNKFLSLQRGQFDTVAAAHASNSKVREGRYYEATYEKSPAYQIKAPLILAIKDEEPDLAQVLKFHHSPYKAELFVTASNNVSPGQIIYLAGTNPLNQKIFWTGIVGLPVVVSKETSQVSEQVESDSENIRLYGLKEITIDSPYITDEDHAKTIASFIIEKTKDPVPILNLSIMSIPTLQLGDRIRIATMDSFDIINGDYWIIQQDFNYAESITHNLVLRKIS